MDASHFQLHVGPPELVLAVLWQTAEASRSEGWRSACRNLLEKLQRRIEEALAPAQGDVQVLHEGILTTLLVNRNRLGGWPAWFLSRPKNTQSFFRYLWSKMPECSQTSIEDDDQAVLAIIYFALGFQRQRRNRNSKVASNQWAAVFALQKGLLSYLAAGLDTYLLHVYMPARPTPKPAPSYRSQKKKLKQTPCSSAGAYCDRRLERMSAFRQVQALSNTIKQLGMWNGIDDFQLPGDHRVDAVEAGEVRVLAPAQDHGTENRNYAVRVRAEEGTAHRVLPDSAFEPSRSYKLLVINLDQGGVGASGVVFAQESMKLMLYAHWDKFHRVIRDINLALNRSTSGLFLKTRIFSAHLWSLPQRRTMGTQSPESPIFRKYAPSIAKALDRSLDTPEDYTSLFDDIPFFSRDHVGARWRS